MKVITDPGVFGLPRYKSLQLVAESEEDKQILGKLAFDLTDQANKVVWQKEEELKNENA